MESDSPLHFMHLSLGDWADGTAGFTPEQEGFYLRLIRRLYAVGGRLIDDDARNAKRLNLDIRSYRRLKSFLLDERKIEVVDGHIIQRRVLRDLEAAKARRDRRSEVGRHGAETRKLKVLQLVHEDQQIKADEATSGELRADFAPTSAGLRAEVPGTGPKKAGNIKPATMPIIPSPSPSPKETPSPLAPSAEVRAAFEAYNATANRLNLAKAEKLTADRARKIAARLTDYGLDGWRKALGEIERSEFLLGKTHHGFRVGIDFVCQPGSFGKLHDGGYSSASKPRLQLLDFGEGETTLSRYGGGRA